MKYMSMQHQKVPILKMEKIPIKVINWRISKNKTERNGDHNKDREEENDDEEEEDDDEDDDDYDDVSIIIGSDDTASFNNSFNKETKGEHKSSRSRPRYQKYIIIVILSHHSEEVLQICQ